MGRSLDFSFGPLDEDGVRSAFAPADHERLTRLRARYDPHGLLHADHRVPAAGQRPGRPGDGALRVSPG